MPTIKKIQETWTSSSITTLFRLDNLAYSLPLKSPVTGFSWSLILRSEPHLKKANMGKMKKMAKCQLLFDSSACHSAWLGAPVDVMLSFPSHPGAILANSLPKPKSFTLGRSNVDPLITCSTDDLGYALVSLEVSFTSLQTCNPFDVLARAGTIPWAPAITRNEGSSTMQPQPRAALHALEQSLETGTSFDTMFQAYTRCLSPGNVARPISTYANSTVLQASTLLPDFAKENLNSSSLFELVKGTPPFTSPEYYEYESDSDLDDEEGDGLAEVQSVEELATAQPAEEVPEAQPADELATCQCGEASALACHNSEFHTSTHDTQPHEDSGSVSCFSSFKAVLREQPSTQSSLLEDAKAIPNQNMKSGFRVILVKGVAWKTWHAFVYYCYSDIVKFSSLRSQTAINATLWQPLHCSPKSMYQLAKKLNNDALSRLAFEAIKTRLSPANILDEVFSKFTARHDDIREMEITLLVQHRNTPDVQRGLPAKIDAVAKGKLPHAGLTLVEFYQQITQMPIQNYPNVANDNNDIGISMDCL